MMNTEEILKRLCQSGGVSGFEESVTSVFAELIAPFVSTVETDAMGNTWGIRHGKGKKLLIEAHADEVGLMVTEIMGGFLRFLPVGGIDLKILPSAAVTVKGKTDIPGVIGLKPPHLQTKDEDKTLSVDSLLIDTGLTDASEYVSVGDIALFDSPFIPLLGGLYSARCMDNRACLAAVILSAELIKNTDYEICFAATVGEEVGLRGAKALSNAFMPDLSVTLDVTFGESHNSSDSSYPLGAPTVCVSPSLSRTLTDMIKKAAADAGIKINTEAAPGHTGTNAWAIASGSPDAHTSLISVPVRYMHSVTEVVKLSDIENTAKIVAQFAEGGERYAF